ncbi:sulfatase-like hydrolase/transferase [Fulvivirgaceae bacterium BMA10]|uniref:Sulfatase-like hydrolase/transferase n=1 Tax=Splendidivirga corallicola TaxID=3051826 RepID=A0ABT8KWN8_9BACT|nr:sulfatase-like hydrolase/transferase [Fulvivirgaceae bacterium BMA10]
MKKISIVSIVLFFIILAACSSQNNEEGKIETDSRPNFLFLFADDQVYESINFLNNPEIKTPNLDKLAAQGVVFTHCFNQGAWGGAVCVASRAMLNSGQYMFAARQGINQNQLWGETFTNAGYETFLTGKWHNRDATALKSFKYAKSIGKGMYETIHPEHKREPGYGRPTAENNSWNAWDPIFTGHWSPKVKDIVYDENGVKRAGPEYRIEQHSSELYADNAIDFLQNKARDSENPFFMYVAFNAPHDPRQSPKQYVDMYPPQDIEVPKNYMPEHPFDQGDHKLRDEILAPFPRTEHQVQVHRSEYYAIITHMDHEIGRILKALEESGKADNTYIIFTADHGLAVGHHGLMGKQNQYDHSVRVPFFIAGPGLKAGVRSNALIYLQSAYATTCDLAGIETPQTVDFPSLKGILDGKEDKVHDAIFGNYRHFQRMIRTDKHKLILYPHNGERQLFDLQSDPEEMVNLFEDKKYEDIKNELYSQFLALQKEVGDTLQVSLD